MKSLIKLLSVLLGAVFIFSGFIKLVDPAGTAIKLEEYFTAFSSIALYYNAGFISSFFDWLHSFTVPLSIFISTSEIFLGLALILSWKPRLISILTFILLIFFGFLTGYSATCDPSNIYGVSCVTDCGCFGDFLPLKPIESFYKDIIFLAVCLPILFYYLFKKQVKIRSSKKFFLLAIVTILCLIFGVYTINYLPLLDFRPYKIGNNIIDLRLDGKLAKTAFVMTKDGQEKTFEKYPYDQGYEFVRTETLEDAVSPTAKDFYLYDTSGNDVTEKVLKGHNLYIVSKDITSISVEEASQLNKVLKKKSTLNTICLSSSSEEEFREKGVDLEFISSFYNLDQTVIKAIIRTNPGIIEIKKGIVLNKWTLESYLKSYSH